MPISIRAALRESIFGLQDGLVSTLGAVTGIAEGTTDRTVVVLAGLVIVAVESTSMAAGSYLSTKSHRQYLERLIDEEKESIQRSPDTERQELWAMYPSRGYSDEEITTIETKLFSDPRLLLEDMAHKELGICPAHLEEPTNNALVMGFSYTIGGLYPVLPYFLLPVSGAMSVSIAGTLAGLFLVGWIKGRVVGDAPWRSGLEMVLIAGFAAGLGFLIGHFGKGFVSAQ
jgi:vacuolar iron transporter family protein